MNLGRMIAISIWALAAVYWVGALISMLQSPAPPLLPSEGALPLAAAPALFIPFVFFLAVALLTPPTTTRSSLLAVIGRSLKFRLLFGVFCIMLGALQFIQAIRANAVLVDISYGFFFSAGLGILAGEMTLAKRRSSGLDAIPSDQPDSGLLASIRRLRATNLTAFLVGTWSLLGPLGTEAFLSRLNLDKSIATILLFVVGSLVFFLIPALVFVVGIQNFDRGTPMFSIARLKWHGIVGLRMLCWFLGAMIASLLLDAIKALFRAVVK